METLELIAAILFMGPIILIYIVAFMNRPEALVIIIPLAIFGLIFASTCIVSLDAPEYSKYNGGEPIHFGEYGYLNEAVLLPGTVHLKWPWQTVDKYKSEYRIINVHIPTRIANGMTADFVMVFRGVRFDPYKFHTLYDHDVRNFHEHVRSQMAPTINAYMQNIDERTFVLHGKQPMDVLKSKLFHDLPDEGLIYNPSWAPNHIDAFWHRTSNPSRSYNNEQFPQYFT